MQILAVKQMLGRRDGLDIACMTFGQIHHPCHFTPVTRELGKKAKPTIEPAREKTGGKPVRVRNRASESHFQPITPPCEVRSLTRSEEHTSELQSQSNLVCRLLL